MNLKQFRRHKETALKAREIVKSTFPTDRRTSKFVTIAATKEIPRGWRVVTITKEKGHRARTHVVMVKLPPRYEGRFRSCPDVKIDCDCSRHLFVWNYALGVRGAALRDRTNGQAPVETNPDMSPGCCKHALITLRSLIAVDPEFPGRRVTAAGHQREGRVVNLTTLRQALNR